MYHIPDGNDYDCVTFRCPLWSLHRGVLTVPQIIAYVFPVYHLINVGLNFESSSGAVSSAHYPDMCPTALGCNQCNARPDTSTQGLLSNSNYKTSFMQINHLMVFKFCIF